MAGLADALELQMWSWGRDIRHPDGNVPVRLGMRRHPDPCPDRSSTYRARAGRHRITLRSFAVAVAREDGPALWLARRDPTPRWVAPGHEPSDHDRLCTGAAPASAETVRALLPPLALWIADYERRVLALLGPAWRRRVQRSHPGRGAVIDTPARWCRLAEIAAGG